MSKRNKQTEEIHFGKFLPGLFQHVLNWSPTHPCTYWKNCTVKPTEAWNQEVAKIATFQISLLCASRSSRVSSCPSPYCSARLTRWSLERCILAFPSWWWEGAFSYEFQWLDILPGKFFLMPLIKHHSNYDVTKILNTYKFNKIDSGSILKRKTPEGNKLLKDTKQDLNKLKFTLCSWKEREYKNVNLKNVNIQI